MKINSITMCIKQKPKINKMLLKLFIQKLWLIKAERAKVDILHSTMAITKPIKCLDQKLVRHFRIALLVVCRHF